MKRQSEIRKNQSNEEEKAKGKVFQAQKHNVPVPETKLNWQRSETRMETERDRNGNFSTIPDHHRRSFSSTKEGNEKKK